MDRVKTQTAPFRWKLWWMAARPKTLWASIAPVMMGTAMAYADGHFHPPAALAALMGALLIQMGTNLANDYYDYLKGADQEKRLGPLRVTQAGLIAPASMKRAFIFTFSLAFLVGVYLIWRGGWPILIVGLLSILFGILYTGGPFPLGYNGLGDIFVLIFFGPVAVAGTYYVQALALRPEVPIAGLAPGLLSTALLTVNNLRDIDTDRLAGKRTLAVRFGKHFAQWEYVFCILVAAFVPIYLAIKLHTHYFSILAVAILIPAFSEIKTIFSFSDPAVLNHTLVRTGKMVFIYSLLFSIGWILPG